eukprot:COSAG02_NODE_20450_length_831_cov_1.046448_2_plen_117_part_00
MLLLLVQLTQPQAVCAPCAAPAMPAISVYIPEMPPLTQMCGVTAIWNTLLANGEAQQLTPNEIVTALMNIHAANFRVDEDDLRRGFWDHHIIEFFRQMGIDYARLTWQQWVANLQK